MSYLQGFSRFRLFANSNSLSIELPTPPLTAQSEAQTAPCQQTQTRRRNRRGSVGAEPANRPLFSSGTDTPLPTPADEAETPEFNDEIVARAA